MRPCQTGELRKFGTPEFTISDFAQQSAIAAHPVLMLTFSPPIDSLPGIVHLLPRNR